MAIDLASGIFIYAGISLTFGGYWSWLNLLLTVFFAFFPDSDFVIFAILRKKMKLASHHIIHFPWMLIPFCCAVGYWWQGHYGAIMFSAAVTSHLVHDSFNPTGKKSGIKWGWPFSGNLYFVDTLFPLRIGVITPQEWQAHLEKEVKGVEKRSLWDEITSRMEPMGPYTLKYLALSLLFLFLYVSLSYFQRLKF